MILFPDDSLPSSVSLIPDLISGLISGLISSPVLSVFTALFPGTGGLFFHRRCFSSPVCPPECSVLPFPFSRRRKKRRGWRWEGNIWESGEKKGIVFHHQILSDSEMPSEKEEKAGGANKMRGKSRHSIPLRLRRSAFFCQEEEECLRITAPSQGRRSVRCWAWP